MRTYRCTASECDESFAIERSRDVPLPNFVHCPLCGSEAGVLGSSHDGSATERRLGYQYKKTEPPLRFVRHRSR